MTVQINRKSMILNMGPQHPSTHGVLRLILEVDGEQVHQATADIGFLHRGMEKIGENVEYKKFIPYTDRLDYVQAIVNNLGYVLAVEKLMGIDPPERVKFIRTALAELGRIVSHLVWLGSHALDIGAWTVLLYCFREREIALDLFEEYCGARLTHSGFRIGGLYDELPEGWTDRVRDFCRIFPARIDHYEELLTDNRVWISRTKDVGVLSREEAIECCVSGPMARGSGIDWDIRRDNPYEAYDKVEFRVPVYYKGDCYDRYLVRMEEMRESTKIVIQCLDKMPPIDEEYEKYKLPRMVKPKPGEVYQAIESPKGELAFYVVSDGSAKPARLRIRSSSYVNLSAINHMLRPKSLIADLAAIIGSVDIILGEIDR